uniref:Uncharacterized protein n=1 Tax=Anopheles quadriannulatus TaxID=34691 RepID=A0A182XSD1_ANOQN
RTSRSLTFFCVCVCFAKQILHAGARTTPPRTPRRTAPKLSQIKQSNKTSVKAW